MQKTMISSSESSRCSCPSEDAESVDFSEAEEKMEEIRTDLQTIHDDLHANVVKNDCHDKTVRACKINDVMVRLKTIDGKLRTVHNLIQQKPTTEDDLVSNFGLSVKLDVARANLAAIKTKHANLRKEWRSQEQHLDKLSAEVKDKENQLRLQSVFCTTQGLILSKMLWKSSNLESSLDLMVTQDGLVLELMKTLDGCLYAFTQTYADEMPDPSAEEYQYVLCLCGILSNLASVPDGRFLLMNQSVCRDVYDQIIKVLPNILVPKAEDLKWIMLTALYNVMICKEGEAYAKNNRCLLQSLGDCITPCHSEKMIILALKIMSVVTTDISNKTYMQHVNSFLPVRRLQQLEKSKDSVIVRKQANFILSSVTRLSDHFNKLQEEELIRTTWLDPSRCQVACTQTCNKKNQEVLACYVFTDNHRMMSARSSISHYDESSPPTSLSSSTSVSSADSRLTASNQFLTQSHPRSVPISSHRRRPRSSYHQSECMDDNSIATPAEAPLESAGKSGVASSLPDAAKSDSNPQSTSCPQSTSSKPGKSAAEVPSPTPTQSEEGQNTQPQLTPVNVNKFIAITIGDNIQNATRNNRNVSTTFPDGQNASIITVFRIRSSKALMASDNSFAPFYTSMSTSTAAFPWDRVGGLFAVKNRGSGPGFKLGTKKFATHDEFDNANTFDVAYGGYSGCCETSKKKTNNETQVSARIGPKIRKPDDCDLPSTSTGCYGCDESRPRFVPDLRLSSSSSLMVSYQSDFEGFEGTEAYVKVVEPEEDGLANVSATTSGQSKTYAPKCKDSIECGAVKTKKWGFLGRKKKL